MNNRDVVILNRWIECSRNGFKLVGLSFLVVSVATVITIVNKAYCYDDHQFDDDNVYLVTGIDFLNDMHNRLNYAYSGLQSSVTNHPRGGSNNNHNNEVQEIVLAVLGGEHAQKVIGALDQGIVLKFNVSDDGSSVEIVQEIENNNIPDDKREQTIKKKFI